jgi:hypothetical protein
VRPVAGGDSTSYYTGPSYQELIDSMEYEVLLQVDAGSWQGDTYALLRDGARYGVLVFGWGSCSGCDALAACSSDADVTELRDELHARIVWRDSRAGMLDYFREHDWEGDFLWHERESRTFVRDGIALLQADV